MLRRLCLMFSVSLVLVGCNFADKDVQYDDPRNPFYKQAQQDFDANNIAQAITDYENALAANPKLAGAHYNLGQIYGDKLGDPISAIYHYKKYLRLAPNSDKTADVKALIDKESLSFAASLPNSTPQNAEAYAQLQSDNATLKKQLEDANKLVGQLQATATTANPSPVSIVPTPVPPTPTPAPAAPEVSATATPAPAAGANVPTPSPVAAPVVARAQAVDLNAPAPATGSRTYKVVAGDSFWKIAKKMYPGDTKNGVEKIKEANKDTVPEGKLLRIGQVLIIPE